MAAVSDALLSHELIKVRLYDPEQKRAMADELATRTEAALCGLLGHTVILYRKHPKRPRIVLEPERTKRSEGEAITAGSASRSRSRARPRTRTAR